MELTPEGAHAAQLGPRERRRLADLLMAGHVDVTKYTRAAVCYDAVAFVRFLLDARIQPTELLDISGPAWKRKLAFEPGAQWNGRSPIPRGTALGFKRLHGFTVDQDRFFHAALAVGGTNIRGVNAPGLTNGWTAAADLRTILPTRNRDASFTHNGTDIRVYMSRL